ncbi:hypothetical protein AVEN_76153-1 [Araneus ventricosus]|uniref:Uncharacterized protein n=1 Tax=Araneus ventricosus TaxID=182803 RepID=A0A4Y2E5K0_ARAVE|nr:hypothetical protein AVEN_76153-1 [Araneus ventricosus]
MDSSTTFPPLSSLRVVGDMDGRPFISPLRVPLMTTLPTAFSPLLEQQPTEICPTSIEVAWPVTAGLGVRVLNPLTPSVLFIGQLHFVSLAEQNAFQCFFFALSMKSTGITNLLTVFNTHIPPVS